jgi:hypothetical protein
LKRISTLKIAMDLLETEEKAKTKEPFNVKRYRYKWTIVYGSRRKQVGKNLLFTDTTCVLLL